MTRGFRVHRLGRTVRALSLRIAPDLAAEPRPSARGPGRWASADRFWVALANRRTRGSTLAFMAMSSVLSPGLLLAAPPLADPNFERSVVLLSAHGPEGAFGWVLNGQEAMSLSELLVRTELVSEEPDVPGMVRIGGPVAQDQVWLLYPSGALPAALDGQLEVAPGITASASRKILELVAAGQVPDGLITLVGYAGWGPWQLENEIKTGAWLPTDVNAEIVFDAPENLWARAYARVGATPMSFTTRTVGSA
jgi:putative transcriptional regulator